MYATIFLALASTAFHFTPFAAIGQSVESLDFRGSQFEERARNHLFIAGKLETKGGAFLVFLRTDGTKPRAIRSVELISDPLGHATFNVRASGSCEWLKKKAFLAYGRPVENEVSNGNGSVFRKIRWQEQKTSLVITYTELVKTQTALDVSCDLVAEVVE